MAAYFLVHFVVNSYLHRAFINFPLYSRSSAVYPRKIFTIYRELCSQCKIYIFDNIIWYNTCTFLFPLRKICALNLNVTKHYILSNFSYICAPGPMRIMSHFSNSDVQKSCNKISTSHNFYTIILKSKQN